MPLKRQHTEAEADALADRLRASWRDGDGAQWWLRKHHAMIRELVDDDWTWAAMADALTRAGITWRTGRPWSAEGLRRTIDRVAVPAKGRRGRKTPSPTVQVPKAPDAAPPMAAPTPEPRFRPATLKPHEPPPPLTPEQERDRAAMMKKLYE